MELWIRSQNREVLLKTNFLYIIENVSQSKKDLCFIKTKNCVLGTYKTKERALEVLDEIQDILKPKYILDRDSIKEDGDTYEENGITYQLFNAKADIYHLDTFVYEMPKE